MFYFPLPVIIDTVFQFSRERARQRQRLGERRWQNSQKFQLIQYSRKTIIARVQSIFHQFIRKSCQDCKMMIPHSSKQWSSAFQSKCYFTSFAYCLPIFHENFSIIFGRHTLSVGINLFRRKLLLAIRSTELRSLEAERIRISRNKNRIHMQI